MFQSWRRIPAIIGGAICLLALAGCKSMFGPCDCKAPVGVANANPTPPVPAKMVYAGEPEAPTASDADLIPRQTVASYGASLIR
jgi:hypothetical protein